MSLYKIYSDRTKCMYFMINDEKKFYKYMTIWEKASNKILVMNLNIIKNI